MDRYDYRQAVLNDVRDWLEECGCEYADRNWHVKYDDVYDDVFNENNVTGNGRGSYTLNAWKAEENLCHNLDLLKEAVEETGGDFAKVLDCAETADVTIRCYLLADVLTEALAEYNAKHERIVDEDDCSSRDEDEDDWRYPSEDC